MNKTAIVTGGTKGIGKAIANRLLEEGWKVIITYSSDIDAANATITEFKEIAGNKIHSIMADITDLTSVDIIKEFIDTNSLEIDAIVFNAGLTDRSDFLSIDLDNWTRVFNANLNFPVFLLQKLYSSLKPNGSVTFTGSLMAIHPHSVSLAYGVSKASVHALVKNLVKFFTEKNIRINAVAPGFVDTEWQKTKPAEIRKNITQKLAAGRFCDPDEITDVYMLLINNQYMNGEIVVCDGAYSYK